MSWQVTDPDGNVKVAGKSMPWACKWARVLSRAYPGRYTACSKGSENCLMASYQYKVVYERGKIVERGNVNLTMKRLAHELSADLR